MRAHFILRNEIIFKTLNKNSKVIHLYLLKGEGGLLLYMTATMVTNRHQFPSNPMELGDGTFCIGKWRLVGG